ncbi:DoxX family protein [Microvirga pakistanensis]|uniref:DoxX family protein n=1 Tax=Microvirga pakistanensis TaxID=1682650 RepID=UPI00106DB2E6|nr:DoxX family protein [Microvirga pakistanensis]
MHDVTVPRPIAHVLAVPGAAFIARLALASPFLISGVVKLIDFASTTGEVAGLGLQPAVLVAASVIVTQLGGSVLFLTRRFCWLGAGILAVFTALATFLAHPFWMFEGLDRGRQTATFFEHVAIVGGLAVSALFVNGAGPR